jgi:transcription initiation factor TFIIH subunit 3
MSAVSAYPVCLSSISHRPFEKLTSATVFCQPPPDNNCLTCGTALSLSGHAAKPVVIPRKKKKKRKLDGTMSAADSPTPGPDTPR